MTDKFEPATKALKIRIRTEDEGKQILRTYTFNNINRVITAADLDGLADVIAACQVGDKAEVRTAVTDDVLNEEV